MIQFNNIKIDIKYLYKLKTIHTFKSKSQLSINATGKIRLLAG